MRYFESLSLAARTAHPRLSRICFVDPELETVLVALSNEEIVGVGRLSRFENSTHAELALLVLDKFQGRGIGTQLVRELLQVAKNQNISQIEAEMFRDNIAMQRVLKQSDFHLRLVDPRTVRAIRKP
jgi:acetyltransferase